MRNSPPDDPALRRVADADDLEAGETAVVTAGGVELALFNVDGAYHALENACPHRGGPLAEGGLDGDCVRCPWHGWEIDVTSGEHVRSDAATERYETVVADGGVYVRVP